MAEKKSLAYGFDVPGVLSNDEAGASTFDRPASPEEVVAFQEEIARIEAVRQQALSEDEHLVLD